MADASIPPHSQNLVTARLCITVVGLIAAISAVVLCAGCSTDKSERLARPVGTEWISRGRELARGLAACGYCHGTSVNPDAPLSGGRTFSDKYGETVAANLTPSKSGLGDWRAENFVEYIRLGIDPDGENVSQHFHRGYEWMSDNDLFAVVGYLMSLAPREQETPRRSISFVERNTTGIMESQRTVSGAVSPISDRFSVQYGQYLTDNVARCGFCHSSAGGFMLDAGYLTGGAEIRSEKGAKTAPDITNSVVDGIGDWSESDIIRYLQSGRNPKGDVIDSDFCPTSFYRNASEDDLRAIARFLKTVAPGE